MRVTFSTLSFRVLAICYYYHLGGLRQHVYYIIIIIYEKKKGNAIEQVPPYHYIHDDFILCFLV